MGGKRKSAKRVVTKKKITAPKIFKCPFCCHEASCEVKLDRKAETGTIGCRVCGETFQSRITYLSDPVDVYCSWVDELEASKAGSSSSSSSGAAQ